MTEVLRKEIVRLGKTITGLNSEFWYLEASENSHSAYAVFSEVSNPQSRDTATKFEDEYFQISLYGPDLDELEDIAAATISVFDDSESNFSVTGYKVNRIERLNGPRDQKLNSIYHKTIDYKMELTKL